MATRWTMSWKSLKGNTYSVRIYDDDWTGSATALTPDESPFSLQTNSDDDIFTPVRTSTGYLRFYTTDNDILDDLMPSHLTGRKVNLYRSGNLIWSGYLSEENYTQKIDDYLSIEIPVRSQLDVLGNIYYTVQHREVTFATLINEICQQTAFNKVHSWADTLDLNINDEAFQKEEETEADTVLGVNGELQEPAERYSYLEILQEICLYLGLVASDEGNKLWLVDPMNGNTSYKIYSAGSTWAYEGEGTATGSLEITSLEDDDNDKQFLTGKNFICLEANTNMPDEVMDVNIKYGEIPVKQNISLMHVTNTAKHYATLYNDSMQAIEQGDNEAGLIWWDYSASLRPTMKTRYGGEFTFASIPDSLDDLSLTSEPTCIYLAAIYTDTSNLYPAIRLASEHTMLGRDFVNGITIQCSEVKQTTDYAKYNDISDDCEDIDLKFRLRWGTKYYNGSTWQSDACTFDVGVEDLSNKTWLDMYTGYKVNPDASLNGTIELTLYLYNSYGEDKHPVLLKIDGLKVEPIVPKSNVVNRTKYDTIRYCLQQTVGHIESYNQTHRLYTPYDTTLWRKTSAEVNGPCAVLNSSYAIPNRIEETMLTRIGNWYNRSIEELKLKTYYDIADDAAADYIGKKYTVGSKTYILSAKSVDYGDETRTITLQKSL